MNDYLSGYSVINCLQFIVFISLGACIAIADFRKFIIPNIYLILLLSSLVIIDTLYFPEAILFKVLSGVGAFCLFYVVYRFKGGLGFGDVKYAGVAGYYLGPEYVITGLLCAVIFGLLYWFINWLFFKYNKNTRIPFGPWLSCGTAAAILLHGGF